MTTAFTEHYITLRLAKLHPNATLVAPIHLTHTAALVLLQDAKSFFVLVITDHSPNGWVSSRHPLDKSQSAKRAFQTRCKAYDAPYTPYHENGHNADGVDDPDDADGMTWTNRLDALEDAE